MKRNMGQVDRLLRSALAVVIVFLVPPMATGWAAVALYAIAGVLALTSAIGYSPVYALLRIDTTGKTQGGGRGTSGAHMGR